MTSRPRVAVVAASLDILGGQGVQARSLVDALCQDGYDAALLPVNPQFPRGLGWLRRIRGARTIVNEALYGISLRELASFDVVHAFSASYWSFLLAPVPAMLAGRALGKRVVLHYHSGEASDHLARWGALVHPWLRLADEIVVPSEYLRRAFAVHGHRARVIPNIVDLSRFLYRERKPIGPRLLSTRNLEPYYRVDLALEAFRTFRTKKPTATLTIAGYGSEERRLRAMAAAIGGDAVRFVGKVDPEAVPALLDAHDVFINASVLDNQPVSILEAAAAGLPIVTSDAGDIPTMLRDGDTGWVVPAGDASALADALIALWRNPDAAVTRARRAHVDLAKYTWPAVRAQWDALYRAPAALLDDACVNEIAIAGDRR